MENWVGRVFQGKNAGKKGALEQQVAYVKAISRGRSSRTGEQAGEIERQGESIADQHGFGGVGLAEGGGPFEVSTSLGGIAALGIGLPADMQLPGIGTDLHVRAKRMEPSGKVSVVVRENPRGWAGSAKGQTVWETAACAPGTSGSLWCVHLRRHTHLVA